MDKDLWRKAENQNVLTDLINILSYLAESPHGSREFLDRLENLQIASPEFRLCTIVGYDEIGIARCDRCPLGPENAGCMEFFAGAYRKARGKQLRQAKLDLVRAANHLRYMAQKAANDSQAEK